MSEVRILLGVPNGILAQWLEQSAFKTYRWNQQEGGDSIPLNTHFVGKLTEMNVAQAFLSKGYQVCEPLVADSRYDFIVDLKTQLIRVQVKTSRLCEDGSYIKFETSSTNIRGSGVAHNSYSKEQIDYFATFYDGICYIVPVEKCGARGQRLRLKPTKNGQVVNIMFAKDYSLEEFLRTI